MTRPGLMKINLMALYYFPAQVLLWMSACSLEHGLWFDHALIMLLVLPAVSGGLCSVVVTL